MATNKQVNSMRKRLRLLKVSGKPATVAQISAAYGTMTMGQYPEELWQLLLVVATSAGGVVDDCYNCKNGMVPKFNPRSGFYWVTCPECDGGKQRRVCNPAPGELPGNMGTIGPEAGAATAPPLTSVQKWAAEVAKVLETRTA